MYSLLKKICPFHDKKMEVEFARIENKLLKQNVFFDENLPVIFILASPRTGSTLLYQLMIKYLELHYFSNFLTEHFARFPLVGTVFENGLKSLENERFITLDSRYGTTAGPHEPNEATRVLQNWFDWTHPTETASARVKVGCREHMINTLGVIARLSGKSIVIKNAWNCFRVQELASMFPTARFVWLRRDIIASSYSTLQARRTQGDPAKIWNSASPSNYKEIRRRPYTEQVVEQQYWTNKAVEIGLRECVPDDNVTEIWYEDILANPPKTLKRIAERIGHVDMNMLTTRLAAEPITLKTPAQNRKDNADFSKIQDYSSRRYPHLIRSCQS